MKILIFGRGVIATEYTWALEEAGNEVEFYVRPGRAAKYGQSVKLDFLDGRTNLKGDSIHKDWPVVFREELSLQHDYDLMIVSITHDKFPTAVEFLRSRIGNATLLVFNNFWFDPEVAVADLPRGQIVWGFPAAGGGFAPDDTLRGGLSKLVFFGTMTIPGRKPVLTDRDRAVRDVFRAAKFWTKENHDFRGWLWYHFILDSALGAKAIEAGSLVAVMDSPQELKSAVLLLREMMIVLEARGIRIGFAGRLPRLLPAGVLGWVVQKVAFAPNTMFRKLFDVIAVSAHGETQAGGPLAAFPRDVLLEARRLHVEVPRLEALAAILGL